MTKLQLEVELADVDVIVRALRHFRSVRSFGARAVAGAEDERREAQADVDRIDRLLKVDDDLHEDPVPDRL